jgi:hypothetical protein
MVCEEGGVGASSLSLSLKNTTDVTTSAIPTLPADYMYLDEDENGYQQVAPRSYVAQITVGETTTKYETLAAAIAAVPTNGTQTTITMIADETVAANTNMTIADTKNIVLDLNGKTITGSSTTVEPNFYFITNKGTLEITDNSTGTPGKITYSCSAASYSNEYVTICNEGGTFTLTKGTIENTSGGLSYAVNTRSVWQSEIATFNMNGGTVSAPSGDAALRVYQSAGTTTPYKNTVNISGGTILNSGIFVDEYISSNLPVDYEGDNVKVEINISGGTVNGLIDFKMRHPFGTSLNITDGDFGNAKLRVRKFASEYKASTEPETPIVHISGGKFAFSDSDPFSMVKTTQEGVWTSYTKAYDVSGGVFNKDLNTFSSIQFPVGMKGVGNTDVETKDDYPYTVGESTEIIGDIILIDGEDYVFALDKNVTGKITYRRTFESARVNNYQQWLVPFDYTIKSADLDKFDFFKINVISNSKEEEGGESDETKVWLHIYKLEAGAVLHANKPYIIRAKDENHGGLYVAGTSYDFVSQKSGDANLTLKGKATDYVHNLTSGLGDFRFYGTYKKSYLDDIKAIAGNDAPPFWYLGKDGKLYRGTANFGEKNYSLQPYRWFFICIAERDYAPSFGFIEDGSEATDLNGIEFATDEEIEGYYTLNGVKVQTPAKGVYIVRYKNGMTKKINIK